MEIKTMTLEWDVPNDQFLLQNGVRTLWKYGHSMIGFVSQEITSPTKYRAEIRRTRVDKWITVGLFATIDEAKSAVENCKEIYL